MKKAVSLFLVFSLLLALFSVTISAQDEISIVIDGKSIQPKDANGNIVMPFIIDGTTYLPVRAISENLGLEISWDDAKKTVFIGEIKGVAQLGEYVNIFIDGKEFIAKDANGNRVYPVIKDGTTYLPVRAIGEAFGKKVTWDGATRTVYLESQKDDGEIAGKYYKIINVKTKKALMPKDKSNQNSAQIVVADIEDTPFQSIRIAKTSDNYYSLFVKGSGKALDVPGASRDAGKDIIQYDSNNNLNQKWIFTEVEDGIYTIQAAHSGLYLDASEDVVRQREKDNSDYQKWTIEYVEDSVLVKVLSSEGFKALPQQLQRGFETYMFSKLPISITVANRAEVYLASNDYFNQDIEKQQYLIIDTLSFTATGQIGGQPLVKLQPKYEIVSKTFDPEYDIWRGHRMPCWLYEVVMEGDVEGQVHKFTFISNEEDSPVVEKGIRAIGVFPYAIRQYIKKLYWKAGDTANSYNGGGDSIWIRLNYEPSEDAIINTFAHELGHVLDDKTCPSFDTWLWAAALDAVPISSYGSSNQDEDLAEFNRLFLFNLGRDTESEVEKVYPYRSMVLKGMLYRADNVYFAHYKEYSDKLEEFYQMVKSFGQDSNPSLVEKDAVYKIVDTKTGKVMTVENGSTDNNVRIILADYTGDDSQHFSFETVGKFVKIINKKSGSPLQLNTSAMCGKPMVQYGGTWSMNEQFAIYGEGNKVTFTSKFYNLSIHAFESFPGSHVIPTTWELVKVN